MNGHNSARYIAETIESLLAQDHTNWELIFWDNQSTDKTREIVSSYPDPRILFYYEPIKMTLAQSRNLAIAKASGDWIAFLDCDDIWDSCKLSRQLEKAATSPLQNIGLVYCRTRSFSTRGDEGDTTYRYKDRLLPEGDIRRQLLLEGNIIPLVSAMASRRAIDAVGPIPEHLTFAEDYWLFLAIAKQFEVACVQEVYAHYRVHNQSYTYSNKLASHVEALEVFNTFGDDLPAADLKARRKIYATLIGLELLRITGKRVDGIKKIVLQGSYAFLIRGIGSHLYRKVVRRERPYA
jgi:glycosyltransferase involved in cell wall biosynthesis